MVFKSLAPWLNRSYVYLAFMKLENHADLQSSPSQTEQSEAPASPGTPVTRSKSSTRKIHRYNHDVDIIFDLPGLQLQMKTEHPQKHMVPQSTGTCILLPLILLAVRFVVLLMVCELLRRSYTYFFLLILSYFNF